MSLNAALQQAAYYLKNDDDDSHVAFRPYIQILTNQEFNELDRGVYLLAELILNERTLEFCDQQIETFNSSFKQLKIGTAEGTGAYALSFSPFSSLHNSR